MAEEIGPKAIGVLVPPFSKDMRELLTSDKVWIDLLRHVMLFEVKAGSLLRQLLCISSRTGS